MTSTKKYSSNAVHDMIEASAIAVYEVVSHAKEREGISNLDRRGRENGDALGSRSGREDHDYVPESSSGETAAENPLGIPEGPFVVALRKALHNMERDRVQHREPLDQTDFRELQGRILGAWMETLSWE